MHATLLRYSWHDYIFFALFAQVGPLHNLINLVTAVTFALLIMPKGSTPVGISWKNARLCWFPDWMAEELRAKLMRVAEKQKKEDKRRVHFEGEEETSFAKHGKNKIPKTWRELERSSV